MSTLQITLKKRTQDAWILSLNAGPTAQYFTQVEIDNILTPYMQQVRALSGLIHITENDVNDIKIISYEFDTLEHIANAKYTMKESALALQRSQLLSDVMTRNNIQLYIVETAIL